MTVADYTETPFSRLPRLHHKDVLEGPSSAPLGRRNLVGLMGVMMGSVNEDDEMYKEIVHALVGGVGSVDIVDNDATLLTPRLIYRCYGVRSLSVPNVTDCQGGEGVMFQWSISLERLDMHSFSGKFGTQSLFMCEKLKEIDIGAPSSIGAQSFYGCRVIERVVTSKSAEDLKAMSGFPWNIRTVARFVCSDADIVYDGSSWVVTSR